MHRLVKKIMNKDWSGICREEVVQMEGGGGLRAGWSGMG
jgi:hypothetical protein